MTNDIGTSTNNITFNDHAAVREAIADVQEKLKVNLGPLLRRILELGLWAIDHDAAEKVRKVHVDYYGGSYWEMGVQA